MGKPPPTRFRPWSKTGEVERGTPQPIFDWLNALAGGFTVDVCASKRLAKCQRYFDRAQDGLAQPWAGETVWCNPAYGEGIGDWPKIIETARKLEGLTGGVFLDDRPDIVFVQELAP